MSGTTGSAPGPRGSLVEQTLPGVTRFDVLCHPLFLGTVLDLLGRWAEDRALPDAARTRLTNLVDAAVEHGTRFGPRVLTVYVRWLDAERIRLDLRWFGCTESATPEGGRRDLSVTIATLDALAVEWGVGRTGDVWVQWIVADSS